MSNSIHISSDSDQELYNPNIKSEIKSKQSKLNVFLEGLSQQCINQIQEYLRVHPIPQTSNQAKISKITLYHDLYIILNFKKKENQLKDKITKPKAVSVQIHQQFPNISVVTIQERVQKKLAKISERDIKAHIEANINFSFGQNRKLVPISANDHKKIENDADQFQFESKSSHNPPKSFKTKKKQEKEKKTFQIKSLEDYRRQQNRKMPQLLVTKKTLPPQLVSYTYYNYYLQQKQAEPIKQIQNDFEQISDHQSDADKLLLFQKCSFQEPDTMFVSLQTPKSRQNLKKYTNMMLQAYGKIHQQKCKFKKQSKETQTCVHKQDPPKKYNLRKTRSSDKHRIQQINSAMKKGQKKIISDEEIKIQSKNDKKRQIFELQVKEQPIFYKKFKKEKSLQEINNEDIEALNQQQIKKQTNQIQMLLKNKENQGFNQINTTQQINPQEASTDKIDSQPSSKNQPNSIKSKNVMQINQNLVKVQETPLKQKNIQYEKTLLLTQFHENQQTQIEHTQLELTGDAQKQWKWVPQQEQYLKYAIKNRNISQLNILKKNIGFENLVKHSQQLGYPLDNQLKNKLNKKQ